MSTPLNTVKDRFESKEKLVAAVQKLGEGLWIDRLSSDRGGHKGLENVSNAKLLRLHSIFTEVKEQFETRDELIDAVLEVENRTKDEGYKLHLGGHPVPRLYDQYKASKRRASRSASDD